MPPRNFKQQDSTALLSWSPSGEIFSYLGNLACSLSNSGATNWMLDGLAGIPAISADGEVLLLKGTDHITAIVPSGLPSLDDRF